MPTQDQSVRASESRGDRPGTGGVGGRSRARLLGAAVVVVLLLALAAWGVPRIREGGALAQSPPGERALRTLRLAGFDRVWVSEDGRDACVLVVLPGLDSPAAVEIAWQTSFATLASAYPRASSYRVAVAVEEDVLLELTGSSASVRAAIDSDDAGALREAVSAAYVVAELTDTDLPRGDIVASCVTPEDAAYLEAKNRAAGLADDTGPVTSEADRLAGECETMRAAVEGKPAVAPDEALRVYAERIVAVLDSSAEGSRRVTDLIGRSAGARPGEAADTVALLRAVSLTAEALAVAEPYGGLLAATFATAERVGEAELVPGSAASDAVLAASQDENAPENMVRADAFERAEELDMSADGEGPGVVAAVVRELSRGLPVMIDGRLEAVPPQSWNAYRRADGTVYWRGEQGTAFALTDGSLRGWAFSRGAAAVVDPENVGVVLSVVPTDVRVR